MREKTEKFLSESERNLEEKKRWEGRIERPKLVSLAGRFYHLQSEMQSTLTLLTVKPVHAFTSLTD